MASSHVDIQERHRLYKFTKVLTLKVAQIVVQSRQGKKISHVSHPKAADNNVDVTPPLQWFNLSIPDEPAVNEETKYVLNGEVIDALAKILCIEIALQTTDGDEMVLEVWTVKVVPGIEHCSPSTVYYRMSVMLKSTLSISRITPAYKLARAQSKESYKIFHKIYGGEPKYDLLGEKSKAVKVSELHTPIGTLQIDVVYRTKMAILPDHRQKIGIHNPTNDIMLKSDHFKAESPKKKIGMHNPNNDIMFKNDHFKAESPKKCYDKKQLDLSKPLTAGAFVDPMKIKELHDTLSQKLPEPPKGWFLAEKEKNNIQNMRALTLERAKREPSGVEAAGTSAHAVSNAIEVPKTKNGDKYTTLMDFPFADGSPIAELANFYQECLQARSMSDEWSDVLVEATASTDSDTLSRQLKMFEDAVPEFDSMVASMFSNSENGSEHS